MALPTTVNQLLQQVERNCVLLPSIQRSFVWKPKQIVRLWDSLMRGYPIGPMLVWRTRPTEHKHVHFHQICRDFKGNDHEVVAASSTDVVSALLDGQQRVTALTIGVLGSIAPSGSAKPRKLHLCLDPNDSAGPEALQYRFDFLAAGGDEDDAMFPVADARGLGSSAAELNEAMAARGITPSVERRHTLRRLVEVIHREAVIRFDPVDGDLQRVLNIFARVNTGGTQLSYVDLLISTFSASANAWRADDELAKLRKELAKLGLPLSNERILKAALLMVGVPPKFDVEALNKAKAWQKVEAEWTRIATALLVAARTFRNFGLSSTILNAENVIVPIAVYAYHRRLTVSYATADHHDRDRVRVRAFVARTLLQRAYWTGAVDDVLVTCTRVLKTNSANVFPISELEKALQSSKPIAVDGLVDELLALTYSDRRTQPLLSMLFPHMIGDSSVQKDHIFPRGRFAVGDALAQQAELLPNLQLLRDADNQSKGKKEPKSWYDDLPSDTAKRRYREQGVKNLPTSTAGAAHFWDARRTFLRKEIVQLLKA